jgi:hypothetical protein
MKCRQEFLFWKKGHSDLLRFGDFIASISDPAKLQHQDCATILSNRFNQQFILNCIYNADYWYSRH